MFLAVLLPFSTCILIFLKFLSFSPHQPFSSTFKQNVANHNTHSHKPAGGVKKVTGVGGTTYEISVWTRKNQDSLGSFCPLSLGCKAAQPHMQKSIQKTTNTKRKCFPVKLQQSLWRTYTENMDQWRRVLQRFVFWISIWYTNNTDFHSYLKNHLVLQCITYRFLRKTVQWSMDIQP